MSKWKNEPIMTGAIGSICRIVDEDGRTVGHQFIPKIKKGSLIVGTPSTLIDFYAPKPKVPAKDAEE